MSWFLAQSALLQTTIGAGFAYLMTTLGAAFVFLPSKKGGKGYAFFMGVAAGIMIAAVFFSLLLPALSYPTEVPFYWVISLGVVLGGAFIVGSDVVLNKIRSHKKSGRALSLRAQKCLTLYSAVTLHNIPEGAAIGVAFACAVNGQGVVAAMLLAVGIGIQNLPEGACLSYPLYGLGFSKAKSFFLSQTSGFIEFLSALLGVLVSSVYGVLSWSMAFSAGAMVAVVCSELIPDIFSTHKNAGTTGIVFGFAVMTFLDLFFG